MKIPKDPDRPKVGKRRLAQFERDTGLTLPDDYRQFLLKHNGGSPVDCRFEIPDLREDALVDLFYSIDGPEYADLEERLEQWRSEMPPGFLVIGCDPGGAMLVMSTRGRHPGRVYFWDHQHSALQSSAERNTYPVGKSFAAFTASLRPADAPSRWDADVPKAAELMRTALDHADGLAPIQIARLATEFEKLPKPESAVALILKNLMTHPSRDLRRLALSACGRLGAFAAPGLCEAVVERLADADDWVRFDAVRFVGSAGYDTPEVRAALTKLSRGVKLPADATRADEETSNAKLRARVDARLLLDKLKAKS